MNVTHIEQIISTKLGKRDHLIENGSIKANLALQQEALEQKPFLPYFLHGLIQVTFDAGEASKNLPTEFLREREGVRNYYLDSTSSKVYIEKKTEDELEDLYPNATTTGTPKYYSSNAQTVTLYPTPKESFTLYLKVFSKDTGIFSVTEGQENMWTKYASNLLIHRVAADMAIDLQNPTLAKTLNERASIAYQDLIGADTALEVANREIVSEG